MVHCENCEYWVVTAKDNGKVFGSCRKYCPILMKVQMGDFVYSKTEWPQTLSTDCCAEGTYRAED